MSVHPPLDAEAARPAITPAHTPYVDDASTLPELTWSAVGLGALLGIVFGASSLYLSLKVGLTVSASIPVAVMSIALFRAFGRGKGKILENNIAQTAGSAGESIAFGVGVTMPALMILGYDMELVRVMLVAALGGLLGILMMIPLRRAFVVKQHGTLPYPEGTACAKVLIAGEEGGSSAKTVIVGFALSFVYQICMQGLKLWQEYPARAFKFFKGGVLTTEASPTLLGVGYIIGPRIAATMVAGGLLSAMVLTPTFALFDATPIAETLSTADYTKAMQKLGGRVRDEYVLYIGAGAVATGGIISLFQSLPIILGGLAGSLRTIGGKGSKVKDFGPTTRRTERDLPAWLVALGSIALVAAIASTRLIDTDIYGRLAGAGLIVVFGFLFVTVSSRLTGEIGSSSNPISGMTVATLLLTCLVFVSVGWVGPVYRLAALSIAGIVCIASSNGGTTSQDLKTGFLVGATPWKQQIAILVGALTSAVVIGFTLLVLNDAGTVTTNKAEYLPTVNATPQEFELAKDGTPKVEKGPDGTSYKVWRPTEERKLDGATLVRPGKYLVDDAGKAAYYVDPAINGRVEANDSGTKVVKYAAPKATLMALIIDGIMKQTLPWTKVILGVFIAVVLQLAGVPALAFAVGVYLPLSTSMPIFLGGVVRAGVDRLRRSRSGDSDSSPAVLLSSGYIAGGAIAGIGIAILAVIPGLSDKIDLSRMLPAAYNASPAPGLIAFGLLIAFLAMVGLGKVLTDPEPRAVMQGLDAREQSL